MPSSVSAMNKGRSVEAKRSDAVTAASKAISTVCTGTPHSVACVFREEASSVSREEASSVSSESTIWESVVIASGEGWLGEKNQNMQNPR